MPKLIAFLLIGFCGALSLKADDVLERTYRQSYPVPSEMVVLEVARGVIDISNGPEGSAVELVVYEKLQRKGSGNAVTSASLPRDFNYEKIFARMAPRHEGDARRVRLQVEDSRQVVFDWDPTLQMTIDVRVKVPPGTSLQVRNAAAGVTLNDTFTGNLQIRSESGSVFAQAVHGDFSARTASGSVTVTEVTGRCTMRSDSGLVLAGRLRGPSELLTSTGSVEIQQAFDTLKVRGDQSEIILGVSSPLPKAVDLKTSAGTITVNIDQNVAVSLLASTGLLGKVRSRGLEWVSKKGGINESSLNADLNGGGLPLTLNTSGGHVILVGRAPLDS